ncbi:MAG: hypothetical protein BAJATHORv1_20092 [Candidatus Thorarchaeota archaeon]|nr:MAG: hypothetical protein BAJATHORv1_20092 [Candidatus Thorarchaeota archaeon]
MRLPVCKFDLETDMLCPNCQGKLDRGEITQFDIDFSKWILDKIEEYPEIEDFDFRRAIQTADRLIIVVKKNQRNLLQEEAELIQKMEETYGPVMVFEGPTKLRTLVRELIHPAVEVGVNSLYLPNGEKESIVMLRSEDKEKIKYSKTELRKIVSAVLGQSVIFQYQDERIEKDEKPEDAFDEKMKEFASRRGF